MISLMRTCANPKCEVTFRPESNSVMEHLCFVCRESVRLENLARCLLREKAPPRRWV